MINKEVIRFLERLAAHNNKEWFHEHKKEYQLLRNEFQQYVAILIGEIAHFDESVKHLQPKECIFRINRDIRFSQDKRPYKTNFGAFISPGGRNSGHAGYYFHVEPQNSFIAGGIYMPTSKRLKAIRHEIYNNTEEFKSIIKHPDFKKHFGGLDKIEMLKTAPKGFPKDFEDIELLNHKHYIASKPISEDLLFSDKLTEDIMAAFEAIYPLNFFLNDTIDQMDEN